jgi:hypothetical protein
MLGFIQKLLPCFSSPQQSDGVFVREGFTTVPEIKPHTTSAPPQHSSSAPPSSSSILPPSRRDSPITRDRNVVTETTTTQIVNTVPPNVVEDSEEGDENWEDWRDPDGNLRPLVLFRSPLLFCFSFLLPILLQ